MSGIVEKRGIDKDGMDSWRVRVFAGRENGKVRWVSRTVHGSERAAQKELAKLVTELEQGRVTTGHPTSLGELIERWLADISPHRSAYTIKEYRRIFEANIRPSLGSVKLDKLVKEPDRIDTFYRGLTERGLAPASVRRHHALLHASLGRAVKWGIIPSNPVDRATPPSLQRRTVDAPAVSDVQRLISAAVRQGDSILATAVALAAVTGCRRGELCALRWSDVDWQRKALRVSRSLTVIRSDVTEGPTKTHARRYVAMDDALAAVLAKRWADQDHHAIVVGTVLAADPYILSRNANGSSPCKPDGLTQAYARVAKSVGLTGHFHELRHFAATVAIASGADVRTVAGSLGHADPSVTLRVYSHAVEERDRALAGVLAQTVLGGSLHAGAAPVESVLSGGRD
jgi:integrase